MSSVLFKRIVSPSVAKTNCFSTLSAVQAQKQFLIVFQDYQDAECINRRMSVRPHHLREASELAKRGIVQVGGALLDNHENEKMIGSVVIATHDSVEDVEKMILNDQYYKGKVWERWSIYPIKVAVKKRE